jgi:hypothetical protein
MITDTELESLSDDNEVAFVQFDAIIRAAAEEVDPNNYSVERAYVTHVLAFLETRPIPAAIPDNPPRDDGSFSEWYRNDLLPAIDRYKTKVRLQRAFKDKTNSTVFRLSGDYKTQIGGHLTAIRKIVQVAKLPESKRDTIFKKIGSLQEEVDRDRTRTQAVTALWLEITSAIGKGAENLDPAIERLEKIMNVFGRAKNEDETAALPGSSTKRLPPPDNNDAGE